MRGSQPVLKKGWKRQGPSWAGRGERERLNCSMSPADAGYRREYRAFWGNNSPYPLTEMYLLWQWGELEGSVCLCLGL